MLPAKEKLLRPQATSWETENNTHTPSHFFCWPFPIYQICFLSPITNSPSFHNSCTLLPSCYNYAIVAIVLGLLVYRIFFLGVLTESKVLLLDLYFNFLVCAFWKLTRLQVVNGFGICPDHWCCTYGMVMQICTSWLHIFLMTTFENIFPFKCYHSFSSSILLCKWLEQYEYWLEIQT